jgi:hypothetical protein
MPGEDRALASTEAPGPMNASGRRKSNREDELFAHRGGKTARTVSQSKPSRPVKMPSRTPEERRRAAISR